MFDGYSKSICGCASAEFTESDFWNGYVASLRNLRETCVSAQQETKSHSQKGF